ncbi:LacI family transcriptional regulator [Streptomyces sp. SB3404]|uniref:LacI family transcriptional regulator n=2 Tax=Streptomyces boncukensis TaxID=2711219 RepID=A0A6G4X4M0_9ACTN|nr:LacI family DNA-binding transcriptional regulator [Streptomyces boncukensis]NGO71684.1 LacI family transcriptional regulator [Streptomyces boncukensis]
MVTLADVARRAGVSPSTVSYVLSGKRAISAPTRERVERSIRELGYHPDLRARALASRRSDILALMVPLRTDLYLPVMMEISLAVATAARAHGYDVLLLTGEEGPAGVRRVADGVRADGVVLMDVQLDDARLPPLRDLGLPAVLIGLPAEPAGLNCVDLDFTAAGSLCVDHLARLGHRELAVLGEAPAVYERGTGFAERTLAGIRERAGAAGMRLLHRPCQGGYPEVAHTLDRILDERPGTTAFVLQNEHAVEPLLSLLRQRGRAVPEDVSVVAVCPDQVAEHAPVPLTSVSLPAEGLGRLAVERLVTQLADAPGGGWARDGVLLLPPVLTVRDSSGPAPAPGPPH